MNDYIKKKGKGNQKHSAVIRVDMTFLNGKNCIRINDIPCVLLEYEEPKEATDYAKNQTFKFWFKLEDAQYSKVVEQLNKNLKEQSVWLDKTNLEKLKRFLK